MQLLFAALVTALALAPQEASAPAPAASAFDHSAFDALLRKHVRGDRMDYAALKGDRAPLDGYLDRVAKLPRADLEKLPRADQMAFWINAYNALTLRSIVDAYPIQAPTIKLDPWPKNSIRQIDDVWQKKHRVAAQELALDDIEHQILRKQFKDARIHAAVNCASIGCPPLRNEAYVGAKLEEQLDDSMRRFVASGDRNRIDAARKKVELSSVFKWFGEDFGGADAFVKNRENPTAVLKFILKYATDEQKRVLEGFDPDDVEYLDYDWTLNDAT